MRRELGSFHDGIDYYIGVLLISKRSIQQPDGWLMNKLMFSAGDHYRTVFT